MKKTVAILLMTTLVFSLVACSVKDTSSKYSSADFSASNTSVLPAIKQEVESAQEGIVSSAVTENASSNISSSQESSSENQSVDNSDVKIETGGKSEPNVLFYYSYEDFLESVNNSRRKLATTSHPTSKYIQYDCLDMLLNEEKILLVNPQKKYKLNRVVTYPDYPDFYSIKLDKKKEVIWLKLFPITSREELNKDLFSLIKSKVENANPSKKAKTCKWGEYYIEKDGTIAYLRYEDYLVSVGGALNYKSGYQPFKEEYFDYFSFKYYPLEKVGYETDAKTLFLKIWHMQRYGLHNEPLSEWFNEVRLPLIAIAKKENVIKYQKRFFKCEYIVHIGKNDKTELTVGFIPIEKDDDLLTLAKQDARPNTKFAKGEKDCKWGEYYLAKDSPTAYFKYDGYLICLNLPNAKEGTQFDPEYFNYFDFEYVSLEN